MPDSMVCIRMSRASGSKLAAPRREATQHFGRVGDGVGIDRLTPVCCSVQGITYLVEKGMLQYEPRAVASFLLENCDKLDKTQVTCWLFVSDEFVPE